jgi:ABC-type nitrate/sulfonate/bicarbonate transport system substrate-binding protein
MTQIDNIWYTRCPVPTASALAIRMGMLTDAFASHGVGVKSLRHAKEHGVRESHFTHTLQNSFRHGGNTPALFARSNGADTVLLGLNLVDQYQAILTRPDTGIRTAEQLRGKRLALPCRTKDKIDFWRAVHLQAYESILRHHGMQLSDVQLVEVVVPHSYLDVFTEVADHEVDVPRLARQHLAESVALLKGEVDVMLGYSVWGVELREKFGLVEVASVRESTRFEDQINNGYPQTLTVSGGLLRERPDLVQTYLQVLLRAVQWAQSHTAEVTRILALETGVAEFWVAEGTRPTIAFSLGEREVQALTLRKAFLLRHGFMQQDFAIGDWLDTAPLLAAQQAEATATA